MRWIFLRFLITVCILFCPVFDKWTGSGAEENLFPWGRLYAVESTNLSIHGVQIDGDMDRMHENGKKMKLCHIRSTFYPGEQLMFYMDAGLKDEWKDKNSLDERFEIRFVNVMDCEMQFVVNKDCSVVKEDESVFGGKIPDDQALGIYEMQVIYEGKQAYGMFLKISQLPT